MVDPDSCLGILDNRGSPGLFQLRPPRRCALQDLLQHLNSLSIRQTRFQQNITRTLLSLSAGTFRSGHVCNGDNQLASLSGPKAFENGQMFESDGLPGVAVALLKKRFQLSE